MIHLLMVERALGAGENRVVIGHGHAAGDALRKEGAVHGSDTRNQSVSGRILYQIVQRAPAALSRNGQRTVFREGSGIAEIGDVLTRGALSGLAATSHGFRTAFVRTGS